MQRSPLPCPGIIVCVGTDIWIHTASLLPGPPPLLTHRQGPRCPGWGSKHSSPTAHGTTHMPHASGRVGCGQHIAMGSAARPESLGAGKTLYPLNLPQEQSRKLSSSLKETLKEMYHIWGAEPASVAVVLHSSPGVWWGKLSCCQPALSPTPSPNQAVHTSRLFSSLECSPGSESARALNFL
jgi:hypothetical protein